MIAHVQCYVYVSIKISTKYTIEQYDIFELKTHKVQNLIQMYIYIKLVWNVHYKNYWYILSNGGSIGWNCCLLIINKGFVWVGKIIYVDCYNTSIIIICYNYNYNNTIWIMNDNNDLNNRLTVPKWVSSKLLSEE